MAERRNRTVSVEDIAAFLEGMEFPASLSDIIDHIEDCEAPDEFIYYLEQMPDRDYGSIDEVLYCAGKISSGRIDL